MANKFLKDSNGNIYVNANGKPLSVDIPEGSSGGAIPTSTLIVNGECALIKWVGADGIHEDEINTDTYETTIHPIANSIVVFVDPTDPVDADYEINSGGIGNPSITNFMGNAEEGGGIAMFYAPDSNGIGGLTIG